MSAIEGRRSTGNVGVILDDADDEVVFVGGTVDITEIASAVTTSSEAVLETCIGISTTKQSINHLILFHANIEDNNDKTTLLMWHSIIYLL